MSASKADVDSGEGGPSALRGAIYSNARGERSNEADADDAGATTSLGSTIQSSLSSTFGLGDLSAVWNRKNGAADIDAAITREIEQKYAMDKWLRFKDAELEQEFFEKYFYGSISTHRAFLLIVFGIYMVFVGYVFVSPSPAIILYMHIALGLTNLLLYFLSLRSNFPTFQYPAMIAIVLYNVIGLGIERQLDTIEQPDHYIDANDPRSLAVVYLFGHVAVFMSFRFLFKTAVVLSLAIDFIFFVQIIFLKLMEPWDFLENFVFISIVTSSVAAASFANEKRMRLQEMRRAGILRHTEEVAKEKMVTEKLLLNILPGKIAQRLKKNEEVISDGYENVTVLFADLVGWTDISHSMPAVEAIELLNDIVSNFDRLTFVYKIEKIKTIGDAYLVACGLPEPLPAKDSSRLMANFALDMLRTLNGISMMKKKQLAITIGIHTGPVVAGVIGKTKFLYDLWGDSVNTASRMQSHGETNRIHVTSTVFNLLSDEFEFEKRPPMQVKGKGEMQTYFLQSRKANYTETPQEVSPSSLENVNANKESSPNVPQKDDEAEGEENAGFSFGKKESKRKRKAREMVLKKAKELDVQLDQQIRTKRQVWYFIDSGMESNFRAYQSQLEEARMLLIATCGIIVELVIGLNPFRFSHQDFVGIIICKYFPKESHTFNILNAIIAQLGLLVLFGVYRAQGSDAVRFSFQTFILFGVTVFMGMRIPYRLSRQIMGVSFVVFLALNIVIKPQYGVDLKAILMYMCLMIFCYATSKSAEKNARREFYLSYLVDEERQRVIKQREESERLLYNILPETVIRKIRDADGKIIDSYQNASVMFADIVGFTVLSSKLDARSIVTMLNSLFSQVDEVAEQKGLEKIKTIGDAYMVVSGLPYPRPDHAKVAVEMALEMVRIVQSLPEIEGLRVNVRIGVHSGDVVGGIIGASKMVFDIWGENVNVASKMESNGTPGCVNISHVTRDLIGEGSEIEFEKREKTVTYCGHNYDLFYARWKSERAPNNQLTIKDW